MMRMDAIQPASEPDLESRAAEALRLARKLAPGPERNELRQIAKTLRALGRLILPSVDSSPDEDMA